MTTITTSRTVSMGHRLASYHGLCSSPHGHNMRVEVEVVSRMEFLDFKHVDGLLGEILQPYDHAMLLEEDDHLHGVLVGMGFRVVTFSEEPTTEAIAGRIADELNDAAGPRFDVKRVTVFETDKYSATVIR